MRRAWARFLDRLLGGRCGTCGIRVFDADVVWHYKQEHGCREPGRWP